MICFHFIHDFLTSNINLVQIIRWNQEKENINKTWIIVVNVMYNFTEAKALGKELVIDLNSYRNLLHFSANFTILAQF